MNALIKEYSIKTNEISVEMCFSKSRLFIIEELCMIYAVIIIQIYKLKTKVTERKTLYFTQGALL